MKKAFTLIEFILVVTIIGVLMALSFSEFEKIIKSSNSFGNLSLNVALQLARNAYNLVPAAYLNHVDLNGKSSDVRLKELVTIKSKNWRVSEDGNLISFSDSTIKSKDKRIIELELLKDRRVAIRIFCDKYADQSIRDECETLVPNKIETKSF